MCSTQFFFHEIFLKFTVIFELTDDKVPFWEGIFITAQTNFLGDFTQVTVTKNMVGDFVTSSPMPGQTNPF